jgi:hypothetical protein
MISGSLLNPTVPELGPMLFKNHRLGVVMAIFYLGLRTGVSMMT